MKKESVNKSNTKEHWEMPYNPPPGQGGFIVKDPFSPKKSADRPKTFRPINREDH
jgi:hypothetical protein